MVRKLFCIFFNALLLAHIQVRITEYVCIISSYEIQILLGFCPQNAFRIFYGLLNFLGCKCNRFNSIFQAEYEFQNSKQIEIMC